MHFSLDSDDELLQKAGNGKYRRMKMCYLVASFALAVDIVCEQKHSTLVFPVSLAMCYSLV